jgi:hypothetical protein
VLQKKKKIPKVGSYLAALGVGRDEGYLVQVQGTARESAHLINTVRVVISECKYYTRSSELIQTSQENRRLKISGQNLW